mgnify:CR=1 FL=1
MIVRYYLPLALASFLQSSTPSAAFSPSPSLVHAKRHNSKLGYHTVTSLDEIDLSTPPKDVSSMSRSIIDDDATVEDEEDANFDWFKTWLPLMPVEFLDREKPTPFKLLGMDIVVFNDGEVVDETGTPVGFGSKKDRPKNAYRSDGTWRAFADRCVSVFVFANINYLDTSYQYNELLHPMLLISFVFFSLPFLLHIIYHLPSFSLIELHH